MRIEIPWAFKIRRILLPVTLLTWAMPCESRRRTPIWDGVNPFLANLQMFSCTWNEAKRGILNGIDWDEKGINKWDGFWYDEKENAGVGFAHVLIWGLEPVWRRPFVWKSRSGNALSVQRSEVRKIDLQRLKKERRRAYPRLCIRPIAAAALEMLSLSHSQIQRRKTLIFPHKP